MNITQLKKVLPILIKHNVVPMIWGNQGIGKTQTVKQLATQIYGKEGFVQLNLASQEVGDLVGLLIHSSNNTVKHARPEWFPTAETNGGRGGIIFLDEINRAHPDTIQAMFPFINAKTLHLHVLPENWKIVTAGNYANAEFQTTDTSDIAWLSRFCQLDLQPTASEFVVYAEEKGALTVADFIAENDEMLEQKVRAGYDVKVTPDRRSWLEMVAPLETEDMDEETRFEVYQGIVGTSAASSFIAFRKSQEKKIRLRDITKNYALVRSRILALNTGKETRFDALTTPLDELVTRLSKDPNTLDDNAVANLKLFLLDLPLEPVAQLSKKLSKISKFYGKDALVNDPVFNKQLVK